MARGKSINLFLMDGDANEHMKCTLANWTGVVSSPTAFFSTSVVSIALHGISAQAFNSFPYIPVA